MRFAILIAAAIAASANEAKNDFDPQVDFSRYRTFAFVEGIDAGHTGLLKDPVVRERLANFISGALETRSLREVPRDEKFDLAIRYWAAKQDKSEVKTVTTPVYDGMYWGGYPAYWYGAWATFYHEYVVENFTDGTLLIDLIDPRTRELVWRTYMLERIKKPGEAYAEAKEHLYKAFEDFPPSDKAKKAMAHDREKLREKYPQLTVEPPKP
jgi:hypothetical protein